MIEIPGYKIHREIDSSDYCRSYSAIHLSSGKTMVVSIFSHSATEYASFKSVFNEIDSKLANKAFGVIAPIKEFIKTQNHTYIISDLLSNSCQQVYKDKSADIQTVFEHIYKIALSINLYHNVGFYHGGISLDNIYHDGDDNLTLGLAAFNENFTNLEYENGLNDLNRASYKAPEKEVSQSKSRDYYSLGVVLYELVFKQKPFIAKSINELEQLKKAAVITIPDQNYDYLKPIFSALLNPNPVNRISSADEFRHVTMSANIQLSNVSYSIKELSDKIIEPVLTSDNQQKLGIPKYSFYISSVVVLTVAIGLYFYNSSQVKINSVAEVSAESIIETVPSSNNTNINNNSDSSEFNSYIQSAKTSLDNQEIASSLMSINLALKIKPRDPKALTLKQKIEHELKIKAIIQQANEQIINGNIISTANNNAIETYNRLQKILYKDDDRAKQGIKKISDAYHRLALKQYSLKNTELAKSILAEGLAALPNSKKLRQLNTSFKKDEAILQAKIKTAEKKEAEQIAFQKRQRQAVAESKEDNKRIALLEQTKRREFEAQKEKQALRNFQIQKEKQRQQQLTNLYREAERLLTDTQLTLQSIDKAIDNLQSLEFLSVSAAKSRQLRHKIDTAFISLTEYQISIQQIQQAKNTINRGLQTNSKNQRLTSLNNQVSTLIAQQQADIIKAQQLFEAEKEEKELPIFGTF